MSIAVPLYGFGASGGSPNKSTIIVTAPTGSTVTCKMGSTTKTAPEKNGVWTFGGLDLGTWTITSTKGGDSATQDVAITRLTVEYVTIVYRITPEFTYTGDYTIVDDSDNPISDFANWKNNWKIRFLTSGTLTFTKLNGWNGQLDVFLVGGGGSSTPHYRVYPGGAGGGYTRTVKAIKVATNTNYSVVVGAGASPGEAIVGGTSSFGSYKAGGGQGTSDANILGYGGSQGGGYSDGNGASGQRNKAGPNGETGTTREFGESTGTLYAGGGGSNDNATGGAGGGGNKNSPGKANTGGGAGGQNTEGDTTGFKGGSGIVIIRNARGAA